MKPNWPGQCSATTNQRDDFKLITFLKFAVSMLSPRNEFEVAFNRDELRLHPQRLDQPGYGRAGLYVASLSVNRDLHVWNSPT